MIIDGGKEVLPIDPAQLNEMLEDGENLMVYGKSGSGKTKIIMNYAKRVGKKVKKIDLSTKLAEAIGGIPHVVNKEYYIELLNLELKELFDCDGEGWILFFDEINQACVEVFNTLYGICYPDGEDRAWAGHSLSKAQIVAAGNLMDGTDKNVYLNELPTPLHERFIVVELVPNKQATTKHLSEKYKDLPQAIQYINVMLDADISPRNMDWCLRILQQKKTPLYLQAKLSPALAAKIYNIQKKIENIDPAKLLTKCRKSYELFKQHGRMKWGDVILDKEEALLDKFREIGLTEEEIAGIVKGEELNG